MLSDDFRLSPETNEQMKASLVDTRQYIEEMARTEPEKIHELMAFLVSPDAKHNLHQVCPNVRHFVISLAALHIFEVIQNAILLEKLEN